MNGSINRRIWREHTIHAKTKRFNANLSPPANPPIHWRTRRTHKQANENKHGHTQLRYLWGPDGPSPLRRPLAERRWVSEKEEYTPYDTTCQSHAQPQRSMGVFSAFKFDYNVILCWSCFNNATVVGRSIWGVQIQKKYLNCRDPFNLLVNEPKENEWLWNW